MRQNRIVLAAAVLLTLAADTAAGQSVVTRTPSLNGTWLAAPRVVQFNFVHRFRRGAAPERRISNSPTFVSAVRVLRLPAMVGATYASNSDVVARMPNEWEFFLRAVPFAPGNPIADVSVHVGFNQPARSVDGELSLTRRVGRVRLLASGRTFTHAFDEDRRRHAVAGGVVLQVTRQVALAADAATLLDREETERVGWSAGAQLGVAGTPHSLSLHVTNITTNTLEGASRGAAKVHVGFEYTVPISFQRRAGSRTPPSVGNDAGSNGSGNPHQTVAQDTVSARVRSADDDGRAASAAMVIR
jgi:hypothetical protein